jgi:bifunctional DNase/RNase
MIRRSRTRCALATLLLAAAWLGCAAESSQDALRPVHVAGVRVDPRTASPVVDLVEDGDGGRALPIWIGEYEAQSIANALEREPAPRPNPHDLFANTIAKLEGRVLRTLVNELRDRTYYAVIELDVRGRTLEIDARPSDAIAVALRTGAPVLVRDSLLARAIEIPEDENALDIHAPRAPRESTDTPRL